MIIGVFLTVLYIFLLLPVVLTVNIYSGFAIPEQLRNHVSEPTPIYITDYGSMHGRKSSERLHKWHRIKKEQPIVGCFSFI